MLNAVVIYSFILTENFYLDAVLRLVSGFFKVFSCIYMPVWADIYAKEHLKSAWLTFLMMTSALGGVLGFTLASVITKYYSWKMIFILQSIGLGISGVCYILIPNRYLDIE